MAHNYDVAAMGNALLDVLAPADDAFLLRHNIAKGVMTLIDEFRALQLYEALSGHAGDRGRFGGQHRGRRRFASARKVSMSAK